MRFVKAYIDGYGKFYNQNFTFEPGFNLIFGPNEAGKTTLISFFRAIFFGFPGRRDAVERYEPLMGGVHGGRLELETTDNRKFSVVIKPGRTLTGETIILNGDGSELCGENARKSLLIILHGVSENIYRTVFAFSLSELQKLETLENDEINAQIYSAGTGVGDVTLPEVLKVVEEKRNNIYKHGGSAQVVPKLVKELERIRSEISDIKKDQERYKSTIIEIENLKKEQTSLSHDINKKRREKEKASRLKAGRENVNELNEIKKQLSSITIETKEFPQDGVRRLCLFEEKLSEKKQELQVCKNQIDNLSIQISSTCIDGTFLEAESSIMSLIEDRSAEMENLKKKYEIESNIITLKTDVSNAIADLGKGWDEDRVTAIDVGKETLQNIRVLTEDLSDAQVNVEKAENNLMQAKKNKEESFREFQEFSRKLEKTRPVIQVKFLLIFGIPIVILLGALFGITFNPVSGIIALILGILIMTALYYFYNKSSNYPLDESKQQLLLALESRKKSIRETEKSLADARNKHHSALEKWQSWLRNNGFSTELDRNGIFVLVESIRKVKELIRKKTETENELQHANKRARTYLERLNNVLSLCNLKTTSLDNISQSIHKLDDTLTKQKGLKEKKGQLEEKIKELKVKERTFQGVVNGLEDNIQNLIAEGGASNAEEFRKFSDIVQKRESLSGRKDNLEIQLARLIGSPTEVEKFKDEVTRESDPLMTDRSIEELENDIMQMEGELSSIIQNIGAKKNQISELERKEKLAGLRLEEEILNAKLQEANREWSINALCYKLLSGSMEIYERERQPFVLKHAGRYLDKITERRYVRVIKKTDDNKLVIETPEGQQKNVTALSRGTAEQLYLSMRLAFIKEYANRIGAIPLIVDDILVNFDPQRAKATIQLFNEVSKENQVIMFTCHPDTLDLCKKEIKDFKEPVMIDV